MSDCLDSYVFGYDNATRYTTAIVVSKLNGMNLDVGASSFDFEFLSQPTTNVTYTFSNIRGGVSNLYKNHPVAPLTIWACGSTGTITYGSNLALVFTTLDYVTTSGGTSEYRAHGHVSCTYAASDGSPQIALGLTF